MGDKIQPLNGDNKYTGTTKTIGFRMNLEQSVCLNIIGPIDNLYIDCMMTYKKGIRLFGFDNPTFTF